MERRWTQTRLSQKSGVGRETISRLEAGRCPRSDTILRLLTALVGIDGIRFSDAAELDYAANSTTVRGHGAICRARRQQIGKSLKEVARTVGISEAKLSRFERGIIRSPDLLALIGGENGIARLCNEKLALALEFASLEAHEAFCAGRAV